MSTSETSNSAAHIVRTSGSRTAVSFAPSNSAFRSSSSTVVLSPSSTAGSTTGSTHSSASTNSSVSTSALFSPLSVLTHEHTEKMVSLTPCESISDADRTAMMRSTNNLDVNYIRIKEMNRILVSHQSLMDLFADITVKLDPAFTKQVVYSATIKEVVTFAMVGDYKVEFVHSQSPTIR